MMKLIKHVFQDISVQCEPSTLFSVGGVYSLIFMSFENGPPVRSHNSQKKKVNEIHGHFCGAPTAVRVTPLQLERDG